MSGRAKLQLYSKVLSEVSEIMIVKLPAIVCYQAIRDPISADWISLNEVSRLFLCDSTEGFYLDPLREIAYCYYCIRCCPPSLRKRSSSIYSSLSKWPWQGHSSELLWWLGREICKTLATHATHGFLLCILVHRRPEISLPKSFVGKESFTRMVSTNPFMYFSQYLICVVLVQTSKER